MCDCPGIEAFLDRLYDAAWIEHVEISCDGSGVLTIEVFHSYPPGISIASFVRSVIRERVRKGVQVEVLYRRVDHAS